MTHDGGIGGRGASRGGAAAFAELLGGHAAPVAVRQEIAQHARAEGDAERALAEQAQRVEALEAVGEDVRSDAFFAVRRESSPYVRRLPSITSQMTIKLRLSPSCSRVTFGLNVTLDGCVDHQEGIADDGGWS